MFNTEKRKYKNRWWTLAVMSIAVIITGLQNTITNVALPTLQEFYKADAATTQWFVNSYILAFAGLLLLMGFVGDKYGRKKFLYIGLAIFGIGSFMASNAPTSASFIVTQVIMGIGAATLIPQTLSIIVDVFKEGERARAIAIWAGVAGLGAGLGPTVGGLLLENYEVSSVFLINIPLVITAMIAGLFVVPESKDPKPAPLDIWGATLSMVSIVALVFAIIAAPTYGWISKEVLSAVGIGVSSLLFFVGRERRIEYPLLSMDYFKNRHFVNGIVGISAVFFALIGMMYLVTQFLQIVRGYSALEAGVLMIPMAVVIAISSIASQKLSEKIGVTKTLSMGVLVTGASLILISFWQLDIANSLIVLTLAIIGAGAGLAMSPSTNEIMDSVPKDKAGIGSSINNLGRQVSGAVGVALLGAILNSRYSDAMASQVQQLPEEAASAATDSVAAALAVADKLVRAGEESISDTLISGASLAYLDAMGAAMAVGAIVCTIIAIYIGRHMPSGDNN